MEGTRQGSSSALEISQVSQVITTVIITIFNLIYNHHIYCAVIETLPSDSMTRLLGEDVCHVSLI